MYAWFLDFKIAFVHFSYFNIYFSCFVNGKNAIDLSEISACRSSRIKYKCIPLSITTLTMGFIWFPIGCRIYYVNKWRQTVTQGAPSLLLEINSRISRIVSSSRSNYGDRSAQPDVGIIQQTAICRASLISGQLFYPRLLVPTGRTSPRSVNTSGGIGPMNYLSHLRRVKGALPSLLRAKSH